MDGYNELLDEILANERSRKIAFEEAMKVSDARKFVNNIPYEFFDTLEGARKFRDMIKVISEYSDIVCSKAYELHTDYDVPAQVFIRHDDYYYKLEHLNVPDQMAFYARKA